MDFEQAFERLIDPQHEGKELSTDRLDPGNWTGGAVGLGSFKGSRYGLSAKEYPFLDFANLQEDQAAAIYERDYWGKAGCDAVPDIIKFDLFDMAVNSGVYAAVKTLQRAVGEVQDGILGPHTLLAIQSMEPMRLVARFAGARLDFLSDTPVWVHDNRGLAKRMAANLMSL